MPVVRRRNLADVGDAGRDLVEAFEGIVDVGFVGALYDRIIGDRERTSLIEYFERDTIAESLRVEIQRRTVPRDAWARFLQRSRYILGAESGTYYLERDAAAVHRAKALIRR